MTPDFTPEQIESLMPSTPGTRVSTDADGYLDHKAMVPGAYGRNTSESCAGTPLAHWQIRCPDGDWGSLNPAVHTVTEHEDGTISVHPSIISPNTKWHGFLERGRWRKV